jgi:Cu(I)/Ag(I) efflux system membrane fusion protein
MNKRNTGLAVAAGVVAMAIGGVLLYRLGAQQGAMRNASVARMPVATERKVLYWHDPMVPDQRFDKPGKSPFMDMDLVPVYADDNAPTDEGPSAERRGEQGGISVSSRMQQSLGVRLAPVRRGSIEPRVMVSGNVAWNERAQSVVQARATGFVEKLYVRATLDRVAKGQVVAELYVPDWIAAQEDYLAVRRMQGSDLAPLLDAARARMRQLGMSAEQVQAVEQANKVQAHMTLRAPQDGVITELGVREGMTVIAGTTLMRINGTATVWVNADVPEAQVSLLHVGSVADASLPGAGNEHFKGRVQAIVPDVSADTRTLKARIELSNSQGRLAPGMFVSVALGLSPAARAQGLLVPSEAVIRTGTRTVVMRADGDGHFTPVDVVAGVEYDGRTEIREGLAEGQQVVLSGQFLIDSEASLRGTSTRLGASAQSAPAATPAPAADMFSMPGMAADPHAGHAMGAQPK